MARGPRADATYQVFPKVVDATLRRDGSLFTPDRAIWTLPLLEELDRRYTGKPDLRADVGFESKLRGQLDVAEPEVVRLMRKSTTCTTWRPATRSLAA
jgi:5-methylcytosine-specific restriction protein B